ncbi:MAG: radical SAM protein [Deltaproteobacteria bacterium]|nr:radical SAM protein [Deltaproteobacteria bacterium]
MSGLKRRMLNAERAFFQKVKKRMLYLHYRFGITTVLSPISCQIEITSVCNYNCVMCNRNFVDKERKDKMMSLGEFKRILLHLPGSIRHIFFIGTLGDAFCHPGFYDFLDIAREKNYHVSIATNGSRLTKERADRLTKYNLWRLHVSLDATDKDIYSSIRGGSIEKIMDNLAYFKERNRNTSLFLAMVLMRDNVDGIDGFLETAKKLKAKLIIFQMLIPFSMQIWSEQSLYNYPDKLEKTVKAVRRHMARSGMNFGRGGGADNWSLQPANGYCDSAFTLPQIMLNGDVVPCCMVPNAREEFAGGVPFNINPQNYIIGNVLREPLMSIWNNKKIKRIRKEIIDAHKRCNGSLKKFRIEDFADLKRGIPEPKGFDYCKVCALRWQVGG